MFVDGCAQMFIDRKVRRRGECELIFIAEGNDA